MARDQVHAMARTTWAQNGIRIQLSTNAALPNSFTLNYFAESPGWRQVCTVGLEFVKVHFRAQPTTVVQAQSFSMEVRGRGRN